MYKKFIQLFISFTILCGLINPVLVIAQTESSTSSVPEYQGVDSSIADFLCTPGEAADSDALVNCINKMYRFGISFGAIALVFFLVFAGYTYIMGGESGKAKAKGILQNALIGIGFLLGSYIILSFINPNLVLIKPIQPPIFDAAEIPSCEDIGFEDTCVIDGKVVQGGGAGGGVAQNCPGGLVEIGTEIPTSGSANSKSKICKDLKDRLTTMVNNSKSSKEWGDKWRVTSQPMGPGHKSQCHSEGFPKSGTCADIGFGPLSGSPGYVKGNPSPLTDSRADRYKWLCGEVKKAGGIIIHNEAVADGSDCGKWNGHKHATNWHLHIILAAPGGGGGGGSSTSGGSRPHCRPIHKFLCDHPANDSGKADKWVWTSSIPEIQANLTELKKVCGTDDKKCLGFSINQVYRSPEYGAHMRSIFEAYAILYEGWTDSKISKHGQYCDGTIQYVKESDLKGITKDSEIGKYIKAHFNGSAKHFSGIGSPTTCLSNHGQGISLDFTSTSVPESKVVGPGKLCHNLPGDPAHFILYSKKRSNEKCNF